MDIAALSGLSNTLPGSNLQRADSKLRAVIESLVSGKTSSDDVATLSIAVQLQSQVTGLKQVSSNLAQASSIAQVADDGASQIQNALGQLQALASQARNPTLNASNRAQLNTQFQNLLGEINRISGNTSFNGKKLLNGDLSGDNALPLSGLVASESENLDGGLSIDNLSASSLLGGQPLDLLSADAAGTALGAIGDALNRITSVRADIGAYQSSVGYIAANVESAIANQQAAQSILQDTDFAEASTQFSLAEVLRNASIALAAQGNKLTPSLLRLVG